jgi:hypothetical protein
VGCEPLGDPCPIGDYADSLPTDGTIVYVDASAAPGGDGTLAMPFSSLAETGLPTRGVGTVVALAKGTYEGTLSLRAGVRVIGACAAETIVTGLDAPTPAVVSVSGIGEEALLRNVTIANPPQWGASILGAERLRLEGVAIDSATEHGIYCQAGGEITLDRVAVRNTRPRPGDGTGGRGITAEMGGRVVATRVVSERNRDAGFLAHDGELVLSDVAVRDTGSRESDGYFGRGINVEVGSLLEASRVVVEGNRDVGIFLSASTAMLEDVLVRDTSPQERGRTRGRGLVVNGGAQLVASRVAITRSYELGVFANEVDTELTMSDAIIADVAPDARDGWSGRGVSVQDGAMAALSRVAVRRTHDVGLMATREGSILQVEDVSVSETLTTAGVPVAAGMGAQHGGQIDGRRVSIEGVTYAGVAALDGSAVALEDVLVERVTVGCGSAECVDSIGFGFGIVSSSVSLERFEITGAETCGVFLAMDGTALDLSSGTISSSAIGACVQVDAYDIERLADGVRFLDNGTNLDTTSLPVPVPFL